MGFEPLEDTLPLPQIVRTMKKITQPSHGRSSSVHSLSSSGHDNGGCKSSVQAWRQETGTGSSEPSQPVCDSGKRDRVWEEIEYLLGSLGATKQKILDGTDWDQDEIYWLQERYELCKKQAMHYVLCLNLEEVFSVVTFPGEKLTYVQVANRVVQGCTERELAAAIQAIGINPFERVYFKVTEGVPVEQAEQILISMLGAGEYVLAEHYPRELNVSPNSGWYKDLKKHLQQKGWVWKSKKINGKVVKVIKGNRF